MCTSSTLSGELAMLLVLSTHQVRSAGSCRFIGTTFTTNLTVTMCQALRKELDAVAAGGDLEALAAGDGGLSAGTFGATHDLSNEVG